MILTSCLTEGLGRLPGVATTDWCDRAADTVARVAGHSHCCVLIGSLDARGFLIQVEQVGVGRSDEAWGNISMVGAGVPVRPLDGAGPEYRGEADLPAALTAVRSSFRVGDWTGWTLGPVTASTLATTSAGSAGLRRAESPVWKRWDCAGEVGEIIAGVCAIPGANEPRVVMVELVCPPTTGDAAQESAVVSAVLETVLPLLAAKIASAFATADRTAWLTPREEEVLWHLLAGEKVPDIAAALGRSVYTVHDHVKSLHKKLGASNRGQLVSRALGHIGPLSAGTRTRSGGQNEGPTRNSVGPDRTRL